MDVTLIAMPWMSLYFPSIQLGLLHALLTEKGLRCRTRTYSLGWFEYLRRASRSRFTVADYLDIADNCAINGLGEWIFAVPPFRRPTSEDDLEYEAFLAENGVSRHTIENAFWARGLAPSFCERISDDVVHDGSAVVGFTMVFGQTVPSLAAAQSIKARLPNVRIVCGGASCDGPAGPSLARMFPWIDVVCSGEAEGVAPQLFRCLCDGGTPPALPGTSMWRSGTLRSIPPAYHSPVQMDEVPTPDYSDFFLQFERTPSRAELADHLVIPFESARGCWWGQKSHCTFCGLNGESMTFRSKSPDVVLRDLCTLASKHRHLRFVSADNIIDLKYFRHLLPRLAEQDFDFQIFYETKSNLKRDHVEAFRHAGINEIQPGIESLSTPILKAMRKGVTAIQNVALLKWCAEFEIRVNWNILVGTPGEDPLEYQKMAELARGLVHLPPPQFSLLAIDRFSPYHEAPERFGLKITGPRKFYQLVYGRGAEDLVDLAYTFDFQYADGRNPLDYMCPLQSVVTNWRTHIAENTGALQFHRGPGFVIVADHRVGFENRNLKLGPIESKLYLACETIQTVTGACESAGLCPSDENLSRAERLFEFLTQQQVLFQEDGRFINLALPARTINMARLSKH